MGTGQHGFNPREAPTEPGQTRLNDHESLYVRDEQSNNQGQSLCQYQSTGLAQCPPINHGYNEPPLHYGYKHQQQHDITSTMKYGQMGSNMLKGSSSPSIPGKEVPTNIPIITRNESGPQNQFFTPFQQHSRLTQPLQSHHTNLPHQLQISSQTSYMYPSQLLGPAGTILPQQNAYSTPAGVVLPGIQRSHSGSTNAEPAFVVDEYESLYQPCREGKYFLTNDGAEQERLDFQYEGFSILLDRKLFLAPLTHVPKHVIDVGTGTGIWAIDFANAFPNTHVVGCDLSAIQPANHPPNCDFFKVDAEEPWVYDYKFDYVHFRQVFTCFDDPKLVIQNAYNHMNPGGWIEFQDGSSDIGSYSETFEGSALQQWGQAMINGAASMGRDIQKGAKWKQWLIEAGFVDVQEYPIEFPLSGWPEDPKLKQVGHYMARNLSDGAKAISWRMLQGLGMSLDEIDVFLKKVRKDILTRSLKPYLHFYVVFGRKPLQSGGV